MNRWMFLVSSLTIATAAGCAQNVATDGIDVAEANVTAAASGDRALEAELATLAGATNYTTESDDTFHFVKVKGPKKISAATVRSLLAEAEADIAPYIGVSSARAQVRVEDFDFTTPPEDLEDMELARLTGLLRYRLTGLTAYVVAKKIDPNGDHGGYVFLFIGRAPSGTIMGVYAKGAAT